MKGRVDCFNDDRRSADSFATRELHLIDSIRGAFGVWISLSLSSRGNAKPSMICS